MTAVYIQVFTPEWYTPPDLDPNASHGSPATLWKECIYQPLVTLRTVGILLQTRVVTGGGNSADLKGRTPLLSML